MNEGTTGTWKITSLITLLILIAITIAAVATKIWVLTAIPVGFLFGFFLERADLCGSSACSEIIMMKDRRKIGGIWIVVVVSMLAFAFGSALGWIRLNPKPLFWASYLVGGFIFGVGTVLAGGCVSGTLFKVGQGNVNSMASLLGIPLGIAAIEFGPLHQFHLFLRDKVVKNTDGSSVTLFSVSGLPYWLWAVVIAAATLITIGIISRRKAKSTVRPNSDSRDGLAMMSRIIIRPWKPWHAGIAIGVLALAAYISSSASGRNYPLGVTHGVLHAELLLVEHPVKHVWQKKPAPVRTDDQQKSNLPTASASEQPRKKVVWWLVALVAFLVVGSHISARLRGSFKLAPKPPDETIVAFFGGLLVGAGAAIAGGCVVGNIMSGVALMSIGNMLFVAVVVLSNWATTYLYLMGRAST
jgi:uncharacterized membrane protein YedE/YeeE